MQTTFVGDNLGRPSLSLLHPSLSPPLTRTFCTIRHARSLVPLSSSSSVKPHTLHLHHPSTSLLAYRLLYHLLAVLHPVSPENHPIQAAVETTLSFALSRFYPNIITYHYQH